ncbi:hypothetical protein BKA62DRAFT_695718 [Auriculariales sp. MPI-PUGE-AT-0066]|nr:hypothetical protein BKA62DRAFT_695718 [Auriculariales sp. MPI-PUGE-AT-0066]
MNQCGVEWMGVPRSRIMDQSDRDDSLPDARSPFLRRTATLRRRARPHLLLFSPDLYRNPTRRTAYTLIFHHLYHDYLRDRVKTMQLSDLSPEQFKALAMKAASAAFVTRCEQVASYCVFVYDWLLTLETERQVLAMPGLSPAKLAYIFCRYWPLVAQPITLWVQVTIEHQADCGDLYRLPLYVANLNFAGAACVLLVRLHAFNGQQLWSTLSNAAAMIVSVTMMTYIAAAKTRLAPIAPGCYPTDADPSQHWNAGLFLAPLLWDMLITVTFIFHAIRNRLRITQSRGAIRIFVREGLWYFFVIATVHGVNATLNGQSDPQLQGLFAAFSLMLPNLLVCRLVINLRQAVFFEKSRDRQPQRDEEIAMASFASPHETAKSEKQLSYEPYAHTSSYTQAAYVQGNARASIGAGGWFKSTTHSTVSSESTGVHFNSFGSVQSTDSADTGGAVTPREKWWNIKFVNSRPPTRQDDRLGEGSYTLSFQADSRSDTDEQVLMAPPMIGVEGKQISPRLKLFTPPMVPAGSRSGLSSLAASRPGSNTLHLPNGQDRSHLRASGGTFGHGSSSSRASSRIEGRVGDRDGYGEEYEDADHTQQTPAQQWPADVHSAGYIDTPVTPLRQRTPTKSDMDAAEGEGDARRRATSTARAYPFAGFGHEDAKRR